MDMRKSKWGEMGSEVKEATSDPKNTVTQTACSWVNISEIRQPNVYKSHLEQGA